MSAPTVPPPAGHARASAADLVRDARSVVADAERPDLVSRLDAVLARTEDPRTRVVVVGEHKQGKSMLVNALLGAEVCAVDDDVTTAVPLVLSHAERPTARIVVQGAGEVDPTVLEIEPSALAAVLAGMPLADDGREVLRAEVGVPSPLLAEGLVVVDTAGAGGPSSRHAATALGLLPGADAVLVVTDASQEYTEPELAFLRQVLALCPTAVCVLSKIDLYPDWRVVGQADRAHLDRAGVGVPLVAISAALRSHALRTGDAVLNGESGYPDLITFLRHRVVRQSDQLLRTAVAREVTGVLDHLTLGLRTELDALRDPAVGERSAADLAVARTRAEGQQQRSARWQLTLNDGALDLLTDLEHDLRDRLRRVTKAAEEVIDGVDPGMTWGELSDWVENEVVRAVCDNFVWAQERSVWLAETVAEHFTEVQAVLLPELDLTSTDGVLEPVSGLAELDAGRLTPTQKLLVGMRGSYGGVLMFGMVTSLMGFALVNPISIGAGLLLGTKAYRDDREQRLVRRRNDAKQAVRRLSDDVVFQVGKQSKDRLRGVQRTLRDHFTGVADQTLRTLNASLAAGKAAARTAETDRERRCADLEAQLATLGSLRARAAAVSAPEPTRAAAATANR
ncbi:dynamin family protein [Rhodococcus antarcticus]|uniref:Dynamin family protein n=1 Tax=Rhodococcus antarcticus TaxID=2987751 RepID=A0ABY6P0X9_9NOCA|nr:dynamin family protein [Rhodococcus antarcticus]UZJ25011.1 dynamin family protein [Rhodococcus antarcticus]